MLKICKNKKQGFDLAFDQSEPNKIFAGFQLLLGKAGPVSVVTTIIYILEIKPCGLISRIRDVCS